MAIDPSVPQQGILQTIATQNAAMVPVDQKAVNPNHPGLVSAWAVGVYLLGTADKNESNAVAYTDVSITSLSAGQAAGTSPILAADPSRKSIMIKPPIDCQLTIGSGKTAGLYVVGGIGQTISGDSLPNNDLYIIGLTAGNTLTLWKA